MNRVMTQRLLVVLMLLMLISGWLSASPFPTVEVGIELEDAVTLQDGRRFLLKSQDTVSWVEKERGPGTLDSSFGEQGRVWLPGKGRLIEWDPDGQLLVLMQTDKPGPPRVVTCKCWTRRRVSPVRPAGSVVNCRF